MIAEIFFRLVNFAVLITVLTYLFKHYILQTIKETMQAQRALQHALMQERDLLAEKQTAIDQEIMAQEQLRDQLMQKVYVWQTYFNEEMQKHMLEKTRIKKHLFEKIQLQQKLYEAHKEHHMLVPVALEKAREQLKEDFENLQKGQAYNKVVLNYLENA